jgi:parallel beta-helix repeat protein
VLVDGQSDTAISANRIVGWDGYGILVVNRHPVDAAYGNVIQDNWVDALPSVPAALSECERFGIGIASWETPAQRTLEQFNYEPSGRIRSNHIRNNVCRGGQYGISLQGCGETAVLENTCVGNSRGISTQNAARGVLIKSNLILKPLSTGIHFAYGARDGAAIGNKIEGPIGNDNVGIQAYFGCSDISITENLLVARQATAGQRSRYGIRVGQDIRRINIVNNTVQGFVCGVAVRTRIYGTALSLPATALKFGGCDEVQVRGNVLIHLADSSTRDPDSGAIIIDLVDPIGDERSIGLRHIIVSKNRIPTAASIRYLHNGGSDPKVANDPNITSVENDVLR